MPVSDPGAGSVGTATDRLAASIRRMASGTEVLAASAVIYMEQDDGTTVEIYPDPEPIEGDDDAAGEDDQGAVTTFAAPQSLGVAGA